MEILRGRLLDLHGFKDFNAGLSMNHIRLIRLQIEFLFIILIYCHQRRFDCYLISKFKERLISKSVDENCVILSDKRYPIKDA